MTNCKLALEENDTAIMDFFVVGIRQGTSLYLTYKYIIHAIFCEQKYILYIKK